MTTISENQQQYKNPSVGSTIGGVITGGLVSSAATAPAHIISPKLLDKMQTVCKGLSADEFQSVEKATADVMRQSGLTKKGVEIIKATGENAKQISEVVSKEIDKGFYKFFPKPVKEFIKNMYASMFVSGKNACYAPASKKIVVPKDLSLSFFHEAGHAINANFSKFGKVLQKCRPLAMLAAPIAMIALWKTKKAPDEKPTGVVDKTTTFVKNNAGKLTFAAFVPMLVEEGLATLRGNKFAKQLLSPSLAKKVAKTNAFGFATYALLATLSSVGIYLGVKVKDSIAHKTPINTNK